jgi:imidazolonepropionase-like amidohydrolase
VRAQTPDMIHRLESPLKTAQRKRAGRARFAVMTATLFFLAACSSPRAPVLAITHVTLIDATGAAPRSDTTVLIENGRIALVAESKTLSLPSNARVIDATGKFLIPGLADMHVHLTGAGEPEGSRQFMLPMLFANGITTVRDMGGYLESLEPLRKEIREGRRVGPEIFFAGPYLDGNPPSFQPSLVVNNATDADRDVHELIGRGVDFIKVQSILGRDAYFAIAAACKREHIPFVGHVPDRVTAAEASDAGQHSIEHLTGVLRACSSNEKRLMREQFYVSHTKKTPAQSHSRQLAWQRELLRTQSEKFTAALVEEFVHNQTWQVPTLIMLHNVAFPTAAQNLAKDGRARFVPHHALDAWQKDRVQELKAPGRELAVRDAMLQKSLEMVGKMSAARVRLMAGTDSPAPFVFPGSSLHDELALLVKAGLTPMQALQAATRSPAEFLGKLEEQGTIEQGKFANLLLLDADPLEDIRNTRRIRAVVLRGRLLDRGALDEVLASVEKFASAH